MVWFGYSVCVSQQHPEFAFQDLPQSEELFEPGQGAAPSQWDIAKATSWI